MDIIEISDDLLIKASKGDLDAFEQIYRASSGFVYNVALRTAKNADDAQEITQEVFLKIFKSLKDFKFQSSFKTWIYRITVNTALTFTQKISGYMKRRVDFDENMDFENTIYDHPVDKHVDQTSNTELINNLLEMLNPDQKECIILKEMHGLSYEEIAQTLEININTVRSRLKRAREILLKREVVSNELQ